MEDWYYIEGKVAYIRMTGKGKGRRTAIDAVDILMVEAHCTNWSPAGKGYVRGRSKILGKPVYLHQIIFQGVVPPGMQIDHINRNKRDNRLCNLRVITRGENNRNRTIRMMNGKPVSSNFPGVCWHKRIGKWCAKIKIEGRAKHIKYSTCEKEAARAYRSAMKQLFPHIELPEWKDL